jgi:hypothetical protein
MKVNQSDKSFRTEQVAKAVKLTIEFHLRRLQIDFSTLFILFFKKRLIKKWNFLSNIPNFQSLVVEIEISYFLWLLEVKNMFFLKVRLLFKNLCQYRVPPCGCGSVAIAAAS